MFIQCTKKLIDQLKIKPDIVEEDEPLISWHANLLTVNRRKTIVLVNDKNRYVIVLHGLKAQDFKKLDEAIIQSIRNTFEQECIKDEVINQFIQSTDTITYTKTKNRTLVARMNKACETLYFFEDLLDPNTIFQPTVSLKLSRDLVGDGKNYFHPNEAMYRDLEEFAGGPIFQSKAFQLLVTLRLRNFKVYRKLIVPENITFNNLHSILQTAFGWQDYHVHEFYIYSNQKVDQPYSINHTAYHKDGYKPIINLVSDEEAFSYGSDDIPMKMDTTVKLSEYMPANACATYVYDFGDMWIHDITMEQVVENYNKNYPTCIESEGETPPEDVGGEGGYEEFVKILADKNHPEYEHMYNWSKKQIYRNLDVDRINRMLKFI